MNSVAEKIIKGLYLPPKSSHKGMNGRVMVIGGSKLFHAASIWSLEIVSRLVDLVHYSSVDENNQLFFEMKRKFRNGIAVRRADVEYYIREDDCVLIGPGMLRTENPELTNHKPITDIGEILRLDDEGMQTYHLTKYLLKKYPEKKWVIDAGALQMTDPEDIPHDAILIPHRKEFVQLVKKFSILNFKFVINSRINKFSNDEFKDMLKKLTSKYGFTLLLKGEVDYVGCNGKVTEIKGGNAGMTKGGTGDVLAGLVAGLFSKNPAYESVVAASYINKKAGEELFSKKGYWFNATDLSNQIPVTMKRLILG